jgi:hypothetical protein
MVLVRREAVKFGAIADSYLHYENLLIPGSCGG